MENECDHTYAIRTLPGCDMEFLHDPEEVDGASRFQTVFNFCPSCGKNFLGDDKEGD